MTDTNVDTLALAVARRFTSDLATTQRANLQVAVIEAIQAALASQPTQTWCACVPSECEGRAGCRWATMREGGWSQPTQGGGEVADIPDVGELTPERIEYLAGAVAAAWCKSDMMVRAKRCQQAAQALRMLAAALPHPQPESGEPGRWAITGDGRPPEFVTGPPVLLPYGPPPPDGEHLDAMRTIAALVMAAGGRVTVPLNVLREADRLTLSITQEFDGPTYWVREEAQAEADRCSERFDSVVNFGGLPAIPGANPFTEQAGPQRISELPAYTPDDGIEIEPATAPRRWRITPLPATPEVDEAPLAELLCSIGWEPRGDAQWSRLREVIPQIRQLLGTPLPAEVVPIPTLDTEAAAYAYDRGENWEHMGEEARESARQVIRDEHAARTAVPTLPPDGVSWWCMRCKKEVKPHAMRSDGTGAWTHALCGGSVDSLPF